MTIGWLTTQGQLTPCGRMQVPLLCLFTGTGDSGPNCNEGILNGSTSRRGETGATRQDRTGDLLITNQPLYQLS